MVERYWRNTVETREKGEVVQTDGWTVNQKAGWTDLHRLIGETGLLSHYFVPGSLYRVTHSLFTGNGSRKLVEGMLVMFVEHFFYYDLFWEVRARFLVADDESQSVVDVGWNVVDLERESYKGFLDREL